MKIKNISNQTLTFPCKKLNGQPIKINLSPGQYMFVEKDIDKNSQVRVHVQKKKLELINEQKADNIEYYHSYSSLPHEEIVKLKQQNDVVNTLDNEEEDEEDMEIIEPEGDIIDAPKSPEETKNKGGRPKGAKNKSKKKKKKGKVNKKKPLEHEEENPLDDSAYII